MVERAELHAAQRLALADVDCLPQRIVGRRIWKPASRVREIPCADRPERDKPEAPGPGRCGRVAEIGGNAVNGLLEQFTPAGCAGMLDERLAGKQPPGRGIAGLGPPKPLAESGREPVHGSHIAPVIRCEVDRSQHPGPRQELFVGGQVRHLTIHQLDRPSGPGRQPLVRPPAVRLRQHGMCGGEAQPAQIALFGEVGPRSLERRCRDRIVRSVGHAEPVAEPPVELFGLQCRAAID